MQVSPSPWSMTDMRKSRFTVEQFMHIVDAYIRWYIEKRIKVSLGSLSPIQYRKSLGLAA